MVKFQLNRTDAPWDHPTFGFRADTSNAILDGSTFDPPITTPPTVWWTVYAGGLGETGITRYTFPVVPGSLPAEPNDGSVLTWNADQNRYVPTTPAAVVGQLATWAKNPDTLIVGTLTYASGLLTTAAATWPDGVTGTLTITSRSAAGDVTGYTVTRVVGAVTTTYTQPTITRDASGNATNVPQITVA